MSANNNPVFKVLFPTGDQAVLAAGSTVDALAVGQVGVFDANTGLSINAAGVGSVRKFFIAVGRDVSGGGSLDDVDYSAGQDIFKRFVKDYNVRCFNPIQSHVVDITNLNNFECDTAYSIKVEFRANSQQYQNYGFNQFVKTFSIKTDCCGPGCDCPDGDCIDAIKRFYDEINSEDEGLLTAQYIDYTTTPGTNIVVADPDAWAADPANADLCLGLRITANTRTLASYCNIPLKYYKMNQFKIYPTVLDPICNYAVETFQEPSFGEGLSGDIAFLEYEAGGFDGKPGIYRTGELIGTAFNGFEKQTVDGTNYNQLNISYEHDSISQRDDNINFLNTILAIPCTQTNTTLLGLTTILDALFEGFDALNDDVAQCGCDSVLFTSGINDVTADGLG